MRRILLTGGGGGIGRALALRLADADTTLILPGRNITALEKTCRAAKQKGATIIASPTDLTVDKQRDKLIKRASEAPLDVLIHNAGVAHVGPFEKLSREDWERTLAINVTVPFLLTQGLLPVMKAGASIVNILSVAAKVGFPEWSSYCMSKAALGGFARSLREELRPRGVRVINIYPTAVDTDIWKTIPGQWPRDKMLAPVEVAEAVAYAIGCSDEELVEDIEVGDFSETL